MEDKDKTIQLNKGVTDDTIEYTFVVPRGEVYVDPDLQPAPTEEPEATEETQGEPEHAERAADIEAASETDGGEPGPKQTSVKTTVVDASDAPASVDDRQSEEKQPEEKTQDEKTIYGLPADHPEMGELAQRQAARRRSTQDKKRNFRTKFYVITTAIIVIVGGFFFSISSFFTIDSIMVQGNSHYTAEEIINMGHATPGRNIIYKANIQEIKDYLEQNPYIKSAVISRKLPSTLVIKVTERKERLAFKYDDDYLVMDENGILLKKTRNMPKTTAVEGLVVNKIKLGEKIGTEDNKRMDQVLRLVKAMIKNDLYFVKFDVSDGETVKAYVYDTLVVKTAYDRLEENMKNGKLHLVLEKLFKDGIKRGTITFEEDGSASFMPII